MPIIARPAARLGLAGAVALSGLTAVSPPAGAADTPSADWGPITQLSETGTPIEMALSDDGGRAAAVWRDTGDNSVRLAVATVSGNTATWGTAVAVNPDGTAGRSPDVALSADGRTAVVTWQQSTASSGQPWTPRIGAATVSGTTPTVGTPVDLAAASTTNNAGETRVKVSAAGDRATAVWTRRNTNRDAETASATIAGTTVTVGAVTPLASGTSRSVDVALSRDGAAAAAIWMNNDAVEAAAATVAGTAATWGVVGQISTMPATGQPYPEIEMSDDGTVLTAAWRQDSLVPDNEVPASRSATVEGTTANWGDLTQLAADTTTTDVVTLGMSADGRTALLVYEDETEPHPLGIVRSRVATIAGNQQTWGTENGPADTNNIDEMDTALSADGAVGVTVWEGTTIKTDSINSATLRISGNSHTWSAVQELTDPNRVAVFPKVGISRGGCRATAVWAADDPPTSTDSRSAVLSCASPSVTAVSPPRGPKEGGTAITITGTGFYPGATVTVGGAACLDVVVVSPTSITCVTPPGAPGAVDVVVRNDDGQTATGTGLFRYTTPTPPPPPPPAPVTTLRVDATAKNEVRVGRQRLVKARTNGRFTQVRATCRYRGTVLRGRDARALCDLRVERTRQRVRVVAAPSCTEGLRITVALRARKGAAPAKRWTRTYRVGGPAVACALPGTG